MKQKDPEIRPPYMLKFFIAIFLATVFFLIGFGLSYMVLEGKYSSINNEQSNLRYELLKFEVEEKIIQGDCDSFNPFFFVDEMEAMGKNLQILEKRKGKDDVLVAEQKERYFLLETKHLLYILDHNKECSDEINTILFFYSTLQSNRDESERVGSILGAIKQRNENVMIYSFDYDLDSSLIRILKDRYGVLSENTIVLNEDEGITGIKDVVSLEKLLK